MNNFNLPPGCSVNDIPGNRPEDEAVDKAIDDKLCIACKHQDAVEGDIERCVDCKAKSNWEMPEDISLIYERMEN